LALYKPGESAPQRAAAVPGSPTAQWKMAEQLRWHFWLYTSPGNLSAPRRSLVQPPVCGPRPPPTQPTFTRAHTHTPECMSCTVRQWRNILLAQCQCQPLLRGLWLPNGPRSGHGCLHTSPERGLLGTPQRPLVQPLLRGLWSSRCFAASGSPTGQDRAMVASIQARREGSSARRSGLWSSRCFAASGSPTGQDRANSTRRLHTQDSERRGYTLIMPPALYRGLSGLA
jgi:hypothetical protein